MTNNKQQTEINAVEYLDKVNQFAKENNTDKPRQQTAVDYIFSQLPAEYGTTRGAFDVYQQAKEMEKEQIAKAFDDGDYNYHYSRKTGNDFEDGKEYFNEVYK
jgi:hypothetical protein